MPSSDDAALPRQTSEAGDEDWLIWQIADSAFPTGGFIHSGGLEAAWQLGLSDASSLRELLEDALGQFAHAQLPFVRATHREPESLSARDAACDLRLLVPGANRASRAQGSALLTTAARAFQVRAPTLAGLRARMRGAHPCHWAPCFGAITALLGMHERSSVRLALFIQLRGAVSTAIRLGAIGPLAAQPLQQHLSGAAERLIDATAAVDWQDAAQTAPLLEIAQGVHPHLYSRLFAS